MARRNGNLAVRLQPVVKASTIFTIKQLREKAEKLKAELEAVKAQMDPFEQQVITDLETGAVLEQGSPLVSIKTDKRRNVKWRQEFEDRLGKELATDIVANTEPTVTKHLVIS